MKNIKIATLGAAVQDVFLMGTALKAKRDVRTHDFVEQFPLGAKVELDKVCFTTGGGATNAAVTFARSGFDTYFMGKVGDDPAGEAVLRDLKNEGVKQELTACDLKGTTGYSVILLAPGGERTILTYRGLSQSLKAADFGYFAKLKADWIYITSLGGNLPLLEAVVHYAKTHKIRIAIDPGHDELAQVDRFRKLIPEFTLLKGNKEELGKLFPGKKSEEILMKAARACPYVVLTDGPKGAWASDTKQIYRTGMYKDVAVLDRTGAGDAFGSGFVAKLAQGSTLPEALTFASANSTSVVQHLGGKAGILDARKRIPLMKISQKALGA